MLYIEREWDQTQLLGYGTLWELEQSWIVEETRMYAQTHTMSADVFKGIAILYDFLRSKNNATPFFM